MNLNIPHTKLLIIITQTNRNYLTHDFSSKGSICVWPEDMGSKIFNL